MALDRTNPFSYIKAKDVMGRDRLITKLSTIMSIFGTQGVEFRVTMVATRWIMNYTIIQGGYGYTQSEYCHAGCSRPLVISGHDWGEAHINTYDRSVYKSEFFQFDIHHVKCGNCAREYVRIRPCVWI